VSRLFIGQREQNLISDITKELFRDVVGQKVYYYAISETKTRNHEIYNESSDKVWDAPVELPALVGSPERGVKSDIFGPEYLAKLEVFLHYRDLIDIGINVTVGDFIRWGDTVYEIANVTNLRNIYGHAESTDGYKLECVQARKGQIDPPQVGPSDIAYSDPDAVQKEFEQTRGNKEMNGEPTGDRRDLQENGVLEKPVTGPNRVVEDGPKGSDFYGDKW
jgi:hypothetical protein